MLSQLKQINLAQSLVNQLDKSVHKLMCPTTKSEICKAFYVSARPKWNVYPSIQIASFDA